MYEYLGEAYRYLDPLPDYRVFIRVGFRSGTALANSFMGGASPRQSGAAPSGQASRSTFTHEMGHLWVGGIQGPQGVTSWFSEGLNTYYTRLLPMRGGFTSVEEYGQDINETFERYYTSGARNLSADSIVRIGFNDNDIRHMPYIRGSLYFADLDSRIRAHSGGKRNLDQVLFEIFERREQGDRFDHDVWIETVVREAGPSARDDFQQIIIDGTKTLVPASDAFGPCFERREKAFNADGQTMDGFEWVRIPSVPDAKCRETEDPDVTTLRSNLQ
jgi:predicted metalloprotease with PDZ domain